MTHSAGVVTAASLCYVAESLQAVRVHWSRDGIELQSFTVYPQILDTSFEVTAERRRGPGVWQAPNKNQVPGMALDGPDVHGALALGRLEQGNLLGLQPHGHQMEVAVADHSPADEGFKVVDLNFDSTLL